ncbi:BON domain-containing protein [Dyella sp. KRB-257]|uniref:BON domain-containing protein n=1 Tax=Dyella sp. KRB-257 TaxID=3400915 RepID=UPI003C11F345
MRTHLIRKNLVAMGLIAAFAAAPLAQVAAQESMPKDATQQTVPDKAADAWITTKVKSEFATTKGVDATDISVSTNNGVVTLSGHVGSSAEKAKAEQVARAVKGVRSVDTSGLTLAADED